MNYPIGALGIQYCFPPTMTPLCVGEVRYLSITDESGTVAPPGLSDLSAGLVLWPFLVFCAATAATSCISAWSQSYALPWCDPDLWSPAPGGRPPAPTPVPVFQPPSGAAKRTIPSLRRGFVCLCLEKGQDNPHTGRSSITQPKCRYYHFLYKRYPVTLALTPMSQGIQ